MSKRTSVTTACAVATSELKQSGKSVYSDRDIRVALTKAKRGSASSLIHYMGPGGHLVSQGFLEATAKGYELSDTSMGVNKITIEIETKNELLFGEVETAIGRALTPFSGVVTEVMEV